MSEHEAAANAPSVDELDALSTDELRAKAFAKAESAHDVRFFWDVVKHLRGGQDFSSDDGSAGGLGEGVTGIVETVTGLLGAHDGTVEPLLRARYITYLQTGS